MITPEEFPYLRQLVINDCYAHQNLTVPVSGEGEPFKHLILTGKNGSGKTTVLRGLLEVIHYNIKHRQGVAGQIRTVTAWIKSGQYEASRVAGWEDEIKNLTRVSPSFRKANGGAFAEFNSFSDQFIIAFFEAHRKVQVKDVTTITREDDLTQQLAQNQSGQSGAELFKQYLVNKKVFQVFDVMEGKEASAQQDAQFFTDLEGVLARTFEDPDATLEFVREEFEFYIRLSDGRRITFNQLSAGFSAFLSILTELLMRTDLLRKQAKDYAYNPCGFVLIDEPETHLHLTMQYEILPLLTKLFPNLQFIVATHSPAVASSIKGATVFDLSTGEVLGDVAAGSSYSGLMLTHFGVRDEFSEVGDRIRDEIRRITRLPDPVQARQQLQTLLEAEGRYMSADLRLEVEAQLIGLE